MKMESNERNGSSVPPELKDCTDSDQEGTSGKIRVLVHQDAIDIPDDFPKRNNGSGERHHLSSDHRPHDFHTKIVEHDDVITPLSEESSSTATGNVCEDKLSVENEDDNEPKTCIEKLHRIWNGLTYFVTLGKFLSLFACFLLYVGNIITDIVVCYHLYLHGNMLWFSLVASFTVIPTVILNCISYFLSVFKQLFKRSMFSETPPITLSILMAFLHLTQIGVFARYFCYTLQYELETFWVAFCRLPWLKGIGWYVEMNVIPYLFIVGAILHCLPQLIIQLYIFIVDYNVLPANLSFMLVISIVTSLLNLSQQLTLCKFLEKGFSTPWSGLLFIYLWYLFTSVSRVLSFTVFITKFPLAFIILCLFHWIIMSIWAVSISTPSVPCKDKRGCVKNLKKYAKGLLFGLMYILCFLTLKYEDDTWSIPTRYLYAFFYSVIFLENAVLTVLWFVYNAYTWYNMVLVAVIFSSFLLGMLFMCVYYRYFHRNIIKHPRRWKCVFLFPTPRRF